MSSLAVDVDDLCVWWGCVTSSRLCGFVTWDRNSAVSCESLFPDGVMVLMLIRSTWCSTKLKSPVRMVVCVMWWDFAANFLVEKGAFWFLVVAGMVVRVDDLK